MTTIGWVRHGITDWNVEKKAQGQTDIPLNDTGRAQARALAERFRHETWDAVYTSDLSRARETAETIAKALGIPLYVDERLREKGCGKIEGTTEDDRIRMWGEDWREMELGIETEESMISRGTELVRQVCERHPGQRVLLVSHGALISTMLPALVANMETREHLHNTSVTLIRKLDELWVCDLYNCRRHLDAVNL
ncbi:MULTISPECIES: histidine phosphatase family protein [Paenibacillus]|uniref:Phosphatase PhoE n=1 Tax=Paenibacillus albilobatus TaxID=2716884 RepID=A0A920C9F6_9BACL|nr:MULTISPECIES: histidine phosphatase family protein [Paenibacillus]MDR9854800.1 histidine phosphatase family protein [Paenibacillus sp. VCA1]GIO29728.1 putative phosphatase PhoE [Paenibacillus albilobatus]